MIDIQQVVTGKWIEENCYLIYNDKHLLIVDPGNNNEELQSLITELDRKPVAILLTHTHFDHIGAVDPLREAYHIPVYVSAKENSWLGDPVKNLSQDLTGAPLLVAPADYELEEGTYTLGEMTFSVVETPGHSIGSVSFIFPDGEFVVTGDALFKGSVGRSDLYTGNAEQLLQSIRSQLFTLPDHYQVYPGHREPTTIGHEKATNPFFN